MIELYSDSANSNVRRSGRLTDRTVRRSRRVVMSAKYSDTVATLEACS
jgi:hypothetical protein